MARTGAELPTQSFPPSPVLPILPARRLEATVAFWERLGFVAGSVYPGYAVLHRGAIELHVSSPGFESLDPASSYAMCYLRVDDVDAVYASMALAGLPTEGIPRLAPIVDQPWGLREFHVVDENGTLVRIGSLSPGA
ncbi:MAG: VOC family protein [Planctomycetota bacterium]